MARIRTIKPDFFRHEGLFEAEQETKLPLRVAYAGLWTACDRQGRFKWQPKRLKLDTLPFDDVDFSLVLDELVKHGFILKYQVDGETYGVVKSWGRHQLINNREAESTIPPPPECLVNPLTLTREARVNDASGTPLVHAQGEGEGEGEGKRKGTGKERETEQEREGGLTSDDAPGTPVWVAYSAAYFDRYGVEPVRNAKANALCKQLVARLGAEEAPRVAEWFLDHNAAFYVQKGHALGILLTDAEKLRTEWATGRRVTATAARQADKTQATGDAFAALLARAEAAHGK